MSAKSHNIVVIGVKGSGKTHLVKTEILSEEQNPIIIYDTIYEYEDLPGFSLPETEADLIDLIEVGENIRVEHDKYIEFERVCYILKEVQERYTLVVDEFHILHEHHMQFKSDYPSFKSIILLGNHINVSTIVITQRPTDLPKDVLSQASALYCFQVWIKLDRDFLTCIMDDTEQLKELELYHYKKVKLVAPIEVTEHSTSL